MEDSGIVELRGFGWREYGSSRWHGQISSGEEPSKVILPGKPRHRISVKVKNTGKDRFRADAEAQITLPNGTTKKNKNSVGVAPSANRKFWLGTWGFPTNKKGKYSIVIHLFCMGIELDRKKYEFTI